MILATFFSTWVSTSSVVLTGVSEKSKTLQMEVRIGNILLELIGFFYDAADFLESFGIF